MNFESQDEAQRIFELMSVEEKIRAEDSNETITKRRFTYETVMPSPKTKEECPEEYIIKADSHREKLYDRPWFDWYAWNNVNWGVKWDACDATLMEKSIVFYSPWGAPNNDVFQAIADKFDTTFFTNHYYEDGGWNVYDYHYSPREDMVPVYSNKLNIYNKMDDSDED